MAGTSQALRGWRVTARMLTLLAAPFTAATIVSAQDRTATAIGAEQVLFFDRVGLSATLEIALLGVPGITDAQRDTIEAFEERLRHRIADMAAPLRRARRTVRLGWPDEPELYGRELNSILALRSEYLDAMRALLTPAQRPRFEHNVLVMGDFDDYLWHTYAKQFTGTTTVGSSTP